MAQQGNNINVPQPICLQYQRWGNCAAGERCRYLHTTGGSTYGPSQGIGLEQGTLGRVVTCRYFASGRGCPYGNECQFLHEGGRGEYRESAAITIVPNGLEVRNKTHYDTVEPKRSVDLHKKLKTKLCNRWERAGTCYYGSTCQFAHGVAELQGVGSSNIAVGSSNIVPWNKADTSVPPRSNVASNEIGSSAPSQRRLRFDWDNVYKIAEVYGDWIESPPRDP